MCTIPSRFEGASREYPHQVLNEENEIRESLLATIEDKLGTRGE